MYINFAIRTKTTDDYGNAKYVTISSVTGDQLNSNLNELIHIMHLLSLKGGKVETSGAFILDKGILDSSQWLLG